MRGKKFVLFLSMLLFFVLVCKQPSDNGKENEPTPLQWLDIDINFSKLPDEERSAVFEYKIKVVGNDTSLYITESGDTLDYLCMRYYVEGNPWIIPVNEAARIKWQGHVSLGDTILLRPEFRIDTSKAPFETINNVTSRVKPTWNHIDLRWAFVNNPANQVLNVDTVITYHFGGLTAVAFNFYTGEYSIFDD
ncbi:hypothetical protein ACFL4T_13950 [candidate division KSB1 bacterium]